MKLANLLEHHRKHSHAPNALKENFGDGFLLTNNRIFKKIRGGAVAHGFRFSTEQNDAYRVLPLSQLDEILKRKVVPYFDNVTVLVGIEKRIPQITVWDDVSDNLKGNAVFHEAAHAVAMSFRSERAAPTPEERTLNALLEESFANTCELLSIIDAGDAVHRIFIELNSYVYMLDSRPHLNSAADRYGLGPVGCLLLLSYLHSNFLREISNEGFSECLRLSGIDAKPGSPEFKNLRGLSKVPFELNIRFREVTTRFYLNLAGGMTKIDSLKSFDFLEVLSSGEGHEFLHRVTSFFD